MTSMRCTTRTLPSGGLKRGSANSMRPAEAGPHGWSLCRSLAGSGLVGVLAVALVGCAIFPPYGQLRRERLETAWGTRIYDLEMLAYYPSERGSPAWMISEETPEVGIVVVPSSDRRVVALDAHDGRLLWDFKTEGPNVARPVAVDSVGELIVASIDGTVYRVNQRNGRVLWRSEFPGHAATAAPVVVGDPASGDARILVTSIDNRLTAITYATGERIWSVQRSHEAEFIIAGQGGPLVVGDVVLAGFSDGVLGAYALEDGVTMWTADLSGNKRDFADIDCTPLLVTGEEGEQLVVVSVFRRGLFAVTLNGGDVAWSVKGEAFTHPVYDDGLVVVPQANGRLWGVDGATGKVRWVSDVGTGRVGKVMLSRKYVIAPTGTDLAFLDRVSGRVVQRWNDGRGVTGTPEFVNGRLYVFGNSGMVHALDVY